MISLRTYAITALSLFIACNKSEHKQTKEVKTEAEKTAIPAEKEAKYENISDSVFVVMNDYTNNFAYDMKYATADNFIKKTVYSCDQCLVRKAVADALKKANAHLTSRGFRIKFYDCYRPVSVQRQMWEIYPNAKYVANPNTTGSIHNRGGAVDITLVDLAGQELEMGTGFDHFGKEAHHAYSNLPDTVLSNRRLLKETMEKFGFNAITSEWWHYNFKSAKKYALSDFTVDCD